MSAEIYIARLRTLRSLQELGHQELMDVLGRYASIGHVSYTHLRAHETVLDLVCRLLLEKKNKAHGATHTARALQLTS